MPAAPRLVEIPTPPLEAYRKRRGIASLGTPCLVSIQIVAAARQGRRHHKNGDRGAEKQSLHGLSLERNEIKSNRHFAPITYFVA
jgi:hypothetical protein